MGVNPPLRAAPIWNPSDAPLYRKRAAKSSATHVASGPNIMPCPRLTPTAIVMAMISGLRVSKSQNIGKANRIENRQPAMNNGLRP
jgi:hypothetical protein